MYLQSRERSRRGASRAGRPLILLASLMLLAAFPAGACSVPVYRWALERWLAETYVLRVSDGVALDGLGIPREPDGLNLRLERMALEPGAAPAFELDYPYVLQSAPVVSGAVSELDAQGLVASPARRELVRRLLDGQSGVWLLVKSGDAAKDRAAAAVLREQIEIANRTLELPEMAGDPVLEAPGAPDVSGLRVEFSLIEIDPADEAERVLTRMLMGSEPDLVREPPEPLAFPVFGRGRVLYALLGPGINARMIMKACAFIVGACACEIKSENPGFDLLLAADWESGAGSAKLIGSLDPPEELPGTALACPAVLPEPAREKTAVLRNAAGAVAVIVLLVGAATFAVMRRSGGGETGNES